MANLFQSSECSVCLEHYTTTKYPVGLACGHVFCCSCVKRIMNAASAAAADNYCPIDRQRFAMSDIRRIYNDGEEETPGQKLQTVAEFMTQLQQKNTELESQNRQNLGRISRLKRTLDEQGAKHQTALNVKAALYQTQCRKLVEAHDAQMNHQRLVHAQEIKIKG